jgi:hypothetical protein
MLGELESRAAVPVIEDYLINVDAAPADAVAQAAGAHWRITGTEKFLPRLEAAVHSSASARQDNGLKKLASRRLPSEQKIEYGLESVEGTFVRNRGFNFVVYLEPVPTVDT